MSSTSWRTRISGWMRPSGSSRPGSVTSTAPAGARLALSAVRRESMAVSISAFSSLTSAPVARRSSGASVPSCLRRPVTEPDLRLRNSSCSALSSASVRTDATRARKSVRRASTADCWFGESGIRLGRKRGLGLRRYLGERCGLGGGEIRQHFAVERAAGRLQAAHELRVRQAVLPCRRIDADHPEPPELALLVLAPDIGVLERRVDRLFRCPIQLALGLVVAFRAGEQLLPLRAPDCSSFDSRHCFLFGYWVHPMG